MEDVECPIYYVVSRALTEDQIAIVFHALKITPVYSVIVTDIHDAELGGMFGEVIRANTPAGACALATQIAADTGRPVVIIGETAFFEAHYADGRKEMHES